METVILQEIDLIKQITENLTLKRSHLSYSSLSAFKQSPKTFIDYKLKKIEQTEAMLYGQMVHCLVLRPDEFDKRYFTFDDSEKCLQIGGSRPRLTNEYKAWYADQTYLAGNRKIVEPLAYKHAKIVADNVRFNHASSLILNQCPFRETKIEWEYMQFLFIGFMDGHSDDIIFDLKTMPDAEPSKAQRTIINDGYYLQASIYSVARNVIDGTDKFFKFYIIAVDKMGGVSVHLLHQHLIDHGIAEYKKLMHHFNRCIAFDEWDKSFDFWSPYFRTGHFDCEKPSWMY